MQINLQLQVWLAHYFYFEKKKRNNLTDLCGPNPPRCSSARTAAPGHILSATATSPPPLPFEYPSRPTLLASPRPRPSLHPVSHRAMAAASPPAPASSSPPPPAAPDGDGDGAGCGAARCSSPTPAQRRRTSPNRSGGSARKVSLARPHPSCFVLPNALAISPCLDRRVLGSGHRSRGCCRRNRGRCVAFRSVRVAGGSGFSCRICDAWLERCSHPICFVQIHPVSMQLFLLGTIPSCSRSLVKCLVKTLFLFC